VKRGGAGYAEKRKNEELRADSSEVKAEEKRTDAVSVSDS